jgi:tetratricopeptide (TPR) repeat protein
LHGFVNFDDPQYITECGHVLSGLSAANTKWAFTTWYAANWHPLTWLSLQLDAQLFGPSARGFHVTNVLLHAATSVVLFWAFALMTGSIWRSGLIAGLFAFHPLHVESVAWIAERKDVLSSFFWMLTCLTYGWYASQSRVAVAGEKSRSLVLQVFRYLLVLGSFAAGLCAKPMLVTLPFVLLLLDYWPLQRISWSKRLHKGDEHPVKDASRIVSWRYLLAEKIPFFALTAASCVLTWYAQESGHAVRTLEQFSLGVRARNALLTYCAYLFQTVWPVNLGFFYIHPAGMLEQGWPAAGAALLLIAITVAACMWGRSLPYLPVGWFWYLGTLVPVIGLVQVGAAARADRYTYVPLVGLFIAGVWGSADLLAKWGIRKVAPALGLAVLAVCALQSTKQMSYWKSNISLWQHTLDACGESTVAHTNLANAYLEEKKGDLAIHHYKEALRLHPGNPYAMHDLGIVYDRQGKVKQAAEQFRETVRRFPEWARARYSLGVSLAELGQPEEAIFQLTEALRCDPGWIAAHRNLGLVLLNQGQFAEAERHFRAGLDGGLIEPWMFYNLARVLVLSGRPDEAIDPLDRLLAMDPRDWRARCLLGLAFDDAHRHAEASAQFAEASRLNPTWAETLNQEAWPLATHSDSARRSPALALLLARQVRQAPGNSDARFLDTLGACYAATGQFPKAVQAAREALAFASGRQDRDLINDIQSRLQLYEKGRPFLSGTH